MSSTTVFFTRSKDPSVPLSHFSVPFVPPAPSAMPHDSAMNLGSANPQDDSPLFSRLPGELRNQIFALAMTGDSPIVDPCSPPTYHPYSKAMDLRTAQHRVPDLSTQLLRTCKRMYAEISLKAIFSNNTFRFTTSFSAQRFLTRLSEEHRELIEDVETDLREVKVVHPAVEREWIQYLAWTPQTESLWAAKVGSLHAVVPKLKTLRINIEAWRATETIRSVQTLQDLLRGPRGLERVVMTGTDGSELLFGVRNRYLAEWGPTLFVGVMRFARLAGISEWMADCVRGEKTDKIASWVKVDSRISLEIMTYDEYRKQTGLKTFAPVDVVTLDPEKGACSLEAYEQRWRSGQWPHSLSRVNRID